VSPDPDRPHPPSSTIQGRGAAANLKNRFESSHYTLNPDLEDPYAPASPGPAVAPGTSPVDDPDHPRSLPLTQYLPDASKSIIAHNTSPDIPFDSSINPYRGCSHGCIYCFARPTHEYLGLSAGLDFETKILVKHDAPALLRKELLHPKWQPRLIACSGVTDCYQPIERKLQLTRRCLEVLLDFRNPVGIVTKNHLVTRDIDLLRQLAQFQCVQVHISITTLDPALTRIMEPRTSVPRDRLDAIRQLAQAGVPVGVMVAPIIPALTDHELPAILQAAKKAGALTAGYVPLRLPHGLKDLFSDWLDRHFPDRKAKVLNRVRDLRGGALNDPNAFSRMHGQGAWSEHLALSFKTYTTRFGLNERSYHVSAEHFRRPLQEGDQLSLFATPPP
jgi:DNA repair photolyase